MTTHLYLLRHGATAANLVTPYRLQGQLTNDPLAAEGVRQAERTREALSTRGIDHVYSSPMRRAVQTARIIAAPHRASVRLLPELLEGDVGRWEGLTWEDIRAHDLLAYEQFHRDPAAHGYPMGESFQQVADRILPAIDELLAKHRDETILVVGHHVVNRVYLASVLGLPPARAREVRLDNCGISIVVHEGGHRRLAMLNDTAHLIPARIAA